MKKLLYPLMGILVSLLIYSCSSDKDVLSMQELEQQLTQQVVVFDVNNLTGQLAVKASTGTGKSEKEPNIPECSDAIPLKVILTLVKDGDVVETTYTLGLVNVNNGTETEPLKLDFGSYTITSFIIFDTNDIAIWATPEMGSYYQLSWNCNPNGLGFTVSAFEKVKAHVDVLCYQPYAYDYFGFAWFAFSRTRINTLCFFGDVCTDQYVEWHTQGSSYAGQEYSGYDFPAIFSIVIKDTGGNVVNDPDKNSNAVQYGAGEPLCIEYPNSLNVEGEEFTFEIWLTLPNGEEVVHSGNFNDTAISSAGTDGFGGTDGVFNFGVGCTNEGNDLYIVLPATGPTQAIVGEYRDGGIVFWVDPDDNTHGLVCDISDLGNAEWGCYGTELVGADGIAIGTGAQNTLDIMAGCKTADIAARLCAESTNGGFSDWFLPSRDELNQMYLNKDAINPAAQARGGSVFSVTESDLIVQFYWSSTASNSLGAYFQGFDNEFGAYFRSETGHVRAVRAF